jgi:hypothetical protein
MILKSECINFIFSKSHIQRDKFSADNFILSVISKISYCHSLFASSKSLSISSFVFCKSFQYFLKYNSPSFLFLASVSSKSFAKISLKTSSKASNQV